MAATSRCYVCPGFGAIYIAPFNAASATDDRGIWPGNPAGGTWVKAPELQSWSLDAEVTDPDEFVTSDTNGNRVTPCSGRTTWSVASNFKLCERDWIYCHLLEAPEVTGVDDSNPFYIGGFVNPVATKELWFFLSWDGSVPTEAVTDNGIYLVGRADPGGFGIDNNESTAAELDTTIRVSYGPFFPDCTNLSLQDPD